MSTSSLQSWICQNIVENSGDAIMFADREGIIHGTRISTEFSMVMVKGDDGTGLSVAAVIRDVSARWQWEKELKERIRILEAGPVT